MAKLSESLFQSIRDFGKQDPASPARQLAQASPYKQMGTTDPLARRVGSLFGNLGVDTSYMQTGQERADAAAFQRQAAAATAELHVERAAERKRERAAFAAERRQLLADARQSAIEADEGVTCLEAEITRLEREPKRLEKSLQAAHVQQAAAEAEAARVCEHGRA